MIELIKTPRLILRTWRDHDFDPYSKMVADPRVMEFYPSTLNLEEAEATMEKYRAHFVEHGFGVWVVEIPGIAPFIGAVGLTRPTFDAPFMPCVEIGWKLAAEYWGNGYATEAARAALDTGFGAMGLDEIVSFTTPINIASQKVMQRLGMTRDPKDDFDHPRVAEGHRLRRHVLYRMKREQHQQ